MVNGAIVTREIRHVIWPQLKQAGFTVFTSRGAWRYGTEGIDVVNFQSFGSVLATSVGVTTFSFAMRLGWFANYIPPTYPPPVKKGKLLPAEYGCSFRGSVLRSLDQPDNKSNDIWHVHSSGDNLAWCIGDVERLIPSVLTWFEMFSDRRSVLEILRRDSQTEQDPSLYGLWGFGNQPSPARSYLTGYVAYQLGDLDLARQKLQEAVDSKCYVHLFSSVEGAINRAI